jgi:hypothetical protein
MPFHPFTKMRSIKKDIGLETALSHLNLKTVDETQTAFALSGIHISESTAFKWREMAKENPTPQFWETDPKKDSDNTDQNPSCTTPDVKTKCFKRLLHSCARIFGK